MDSHANGHPEQTCPKFPLGQTVITRNALSRLPAAEVLASIGRHVIGDWGDMDAHDWQANDDALRHGGRLFSAYRTASGVKFWVITEWDRSCTTVLLPEDY